MMHCFLEMPNQQVQAVKTIIIIKPHSMPLEAMGCHETLADVKQPSRNDVTSNVTGCYRGRKRKLRAGYRVPSLKQTSHVAMCFHRRVWYRAFSLRYACVRSLGIILIP